MTQTPAIASGAIAKLLATLPSLDLDPTAVCAAAGFDAHICDDVDARVPLPALHALWEAVMASVRRADIALVVADRYVPGDYGLVGFVAMASPSVGEALRQVERYLRLWTDEPGCRLHGDGVLEVVYRTALPDRPGLHRATEATFAEIVHGLRRQAQRPLAPREVRFAHRAPPHPRDRDAFEAFFRAPVRWDAGTTAMALDPDDLALPLPRLDPQLVEFLRRLASEALTSRGAPTGLLASVRSIVAEDLQRGLPGIDVVARRLGVSARTLRRRLEAHGTTFRDLTDRTRAEVAESYMRDRRMPLAEVAFLLGFSETSAFTRAFKRWTSSTPGAWRQRRAP